MLNKLFIVFKIPELRQKIILTFILLAVYRMGFFISLPFINQEAVLAGVNNMKSQSGGIGQALQMVSLISGADIMKGTIFGLGIMPYISASIIFQLLGSVYPPLERLQKEGESGRRKINEYTRYATIVICLIQSYFMLLSLKGGMGGMTQGFIYEEYSTFFWIMIGTISMTVGTTFLMWVGEQIDAYGIGNGISLLIMAGILARMPSAGFTLLEPAFKGNMALGSENGIERLLVLAVLFVAIIYWVVLITKGERRIPMQSAKHVRGRRVMGGQRQHLPLRVNQAGVMPIIFAGSLLMFPTIVFGQLYTAFPNVPGLGTVAGAFDMNGKGFVYNVCYIALIYFFCYFWTAITFNPKDMAENLKDYGSFIPGYRPGPRTASYLESVMVRITYVGAAFLALVAVVPVLISGGMNIPFTTSQFFGGTGLLIVVSVALDLVQKIDSHLTMRNYSGLLESDN